MKLAILGATSHVAKNIIAIMAQQGSDEWTLFARDTAKLTRFLERIEVASPIKVRDIQAFGSESYDVIINCVGITDQAILRTNPLAVFELTEIYDNRILAYLRHNPSALYINFSSGAVYGQSFLCPVERASEARIPVNTMSAADAYGIAKLNAEAKHRTSVDLKIIDLRLFAFFSRFADVEQRYLVNDIVTSIRNHAVFVTDDTDIVRDFVHPTDLMQLIRCCIQSPGNAVYDVYSQRSLHKLELIDAIRTRYGVRVEIRPCDEKMSATGIKPFYASVNHRAAEIGYAPRFTAIDAILDEMDYLLKGSTLA